MSSNGSGSLRDAGAATRFYDERFRQGYMDDWPKEKLDRVASLLRELPLPPKGRALDFGCGVGMFTEVLASALPGWEIEGTDLSTVAVEAAALRLPHCSFLPFDDISRRAGQYDLIFTHHVLEHVSDIEGTARLLNRLSKPSACLFHILPCGNAGSFSHGVCLLRRDGIRTEPERVFFCDEEGHLRRLDTSSLVALWERDGFRLDRAWYAEHSVSAVRYRTGFGLGEVLEFADPDKAVDERARRKLLRLRNGMIALWAVRKPVTVVSNKRRFGCHNVRDYVVLLGALAVYPVAALVDWSVGHLASREWTKRRLDERGGEMYVYLVRT